MYSQNRGGPRRGQRFSMAHASRETRFAAVKAALRKQSLTFEPYSEEVIHALWDELQERHGRGVYCMLRKGLQNALLARLARPLDDGRMSKNKVNKIFQVLIRSCFVLHSRGGHGEDGDDELCLHAPLSSSEQVWPSLTPLGSYGSSDARRRSPGGGGDGGDGGGGGDDGPLSPGVNRNGSDGGGSGSRKAIGNVETPGSTRPFVLEMDWASGGMVRVGGGGGGGRGGGGGGGGGGGNELRQQGETEASGTVCSERSLCLEEHTHQTPSPCTTVTWTGYSWARAAAPSSSSRNQAEEGTDSDLSLTPEEKGVFARTGILPAGMGHGGGGGEGGDGSASGSANGLLSCMRLVRDSTEGTTPLTAFSYPTPGSDSFRRLNLSPAGVSKSDLRRSVSSEDLLAGLTIRTERDGTDYDEYGLGQAPGEAPRILQATAMRGATAPKQSSGVSGAATATSGGSGGGGGSDGLAGAAVGGGGGVGGDEDESAGAVCELREDVGSLEEVILTHNAFIRKVASEAGIRLPAGEWAAFFGYDQPVSAELDAARNRPVPPLPPPESDPLGYMNKEQLYKFRTAWCTRSHPHVEEFCEHGHEGVNHGWLRRNPSQHPYLPKRCSRVILPGPGGEFLDECTKGRSCPAAHSLEEIQYHPQAYKSQVCPHGSRCRSKAFCPHAHVLGPGGSNGVGSGGMGRSRSADGGGRGGGGGGGGGDDDEGVLCGGRRSQPGTPDGTCAGKREEEWQTVGRRGRRAPSPADSEGQTWVPPARVRSRSWSGSECWSPGLFDVGTGGCTREFRRRATGVTGLLAALRKRSADVMQPPAKHEELLRTIYSTLRRREPNGCDEKELVGRVFHSSAVVDKTGSAGPAGLGPACDPGGSGVGSTSGPGPGALSDVSDNHPFSKTKVRGAVTLLKFAQAVRVGRGESAGQHVLYVAHELPTFSDFVTRHNRHLVEMARELGVDMTSQDWKSLLETDRSRGGVRALPSPSPTNQSESSTSTESPATADRGRNAWAAESPTRVHRRPSPCPKPPQQAQRFSGIPLPSPPSRQGTPQSPAHGRTRSLSTSPPTQSNIHQTDPPFLHRTTSDRAPATVGEHAMWHGGQLVPPPTQQSQHHSQQQQQQQSTGTPQYPHLHSLQPLVPPPSSPAGAVVGGAWAQAGPGGLAQRLQVGGGGGTLPRSSSAPSSNMQHGGGQMKRHGHGHGQAQTLLVPSPGPGGNVTVSHVMVAAAATPHGTGANMPPPTPPPQTPAPPPPPPMIGIPGAYAMPPQGPSQGGRSSPFMEQGPNVGAVAMGYGMGPPADGGACDDGGRTAAGFSASTFAHSPVYPAFGGGGGGGGGDGIGSNDTTGSSGSGGTSAADRSSFGFGASGRTVPQDTGVSSSAVVGLSRMRADGGGGGYGRHHAVHGQGHAQVISSAENQHGQSQRGAQRQYSASQGGGPPLAPNVMPSATGWQVQQQQQHHHHHHQHQQVPRESLPQQQQHQTSFGQKSQPSLQPPAPAQSPPPSSTSAPSSRSARQPPSINTALANATIGSGFTNRPGHTEPLTSLDLRRQVSLPPLSGAQPILTPARMAQTPPAAVSRLAFQHTSALRPPDFLSTNGRGAAAAAAVAASMTRAEEGSEADAAAAAAAVAAGGAAEEWERQRSLITSRGSWPAESRIAAAAAAQKAEEETSRTVAQAGVEGGGDGSTKMDGSSDPAAAEQRIAGYPRHGREERGESSPRGVAGGGAEADDGREFAQDGTEEGERSALPGLSDLVPSGPRYNLF